jgi:NAD(P)-dependent dehydrogenase (short-subunit alcohol dehydrogenase family)
MLSEQQVATITGASQAIGAGAVQALRKLGYAVVANSRPITFSAGPGVLTAPGDIADRETGGRLVDLAVEHFGQVGTLVNNAGVFVAKPFTDYTDADFDMITGVNLPGFFSVTRQAIAAMLRNHGARGRHVVNTSISLVDHANSAVRSALASLTKGGANAVTRWLAIEYAACGVRVNTVSPGIIRTPMPGPHQSRRPAQGSARIPRPRSPEALSSRAEETHDTLAALHPVGRMGDVGDIVEAIVYLETAESVTGEILDVEGGQSAGH